MAKTRSR